MKTVYSNIVKIDNYKPMFNVGDEWYVCFDKKEIMEEAKPVLKGGKFVKDDSLVSTGQCSYSYIKYDHKPSINVIKNDLEEIINSSVSNKIMNYFYWKGAKINLSRENQMNYKASYDLALQSGSKNLPIRIKATKNGKSEYFVFFTLAEFEEFYVAVNRHINNCLEEGWQKKDSIDYSIYQA